MVRVHREWFVGTATSWWEVVHSMYLGSGTENSLRLSESKRSVGCELLLIGLVLFWLDFTLKIVWPLLCAWKCEGQRQKGNERWVNHQMPPFLQKTITVALKKCNKRWSCNTHDHFRICSNDLLSPFTHSFVRKKVNNNHENNNNNNYNNIVQHYLTTIFINLVIVTCWRIAFQRRFRSLICHIYLRYLLCHHCLGLLKGGRHNDMWGGGLYDRNDENVAWICSQIHH